MTRGLNPTTWAYDASTPAPTTDPTRTVTSTVPFDYAKYFASEPTLQAALQQINTSGLAQKAQLATGAQQLYGRLGEMPTNLSPELIRLLGYDNPDKLAALRSAVTAGNEAGTSALARLQHDYNVQQSGDVGSLISRGALHSGELGQRLNEDTRALTLGQYDARQKALDALGQLQSTYLTGQQDLAKQAATAVSSAQERAGTLINAGLLGPTQQTRTVTNPYLNPAAPTQVSGGVRVGSTTTYEPKPTAGNYIPSRPLNPNNPPDVPGGYPKGYPNTFPKTLGGTPVKPTAAPYRAPSLGFKAAY